MSSEHKSSHHRRLKKRKSSKKFTGTFSDYDVADPERVPSVSGSPNLVFRKMRADKFAPHLSQDITDVLRSKYADLEEALKDQILNDETLQNLSSLRSSENDSNDSMIRRFQKIEQSYNTRLQAQDAFEYKLLDAAGHCMKDDDERCSMETRAAMRTQSEILAKRIDCRFDEDRKSLMSFFDKEYREKHEDLIVPWPDQGDSKAILGQPKLDTVEETEFKLKKKKNLFAPGDDDLFIPRYKLYNDFVQQPDITLPKIKPKTEKQLYAKPCCVVRPESVIFLDAEPLKRSYQTIDVLNSTKWANSIRIDGPFNKLFAVVEKSENNNVSAIASGCSKKFQILYRPTSRIAVQDKFVIIGKYGSSVEVKMFAYVTPPALLLQREFQIGACMLREEKTTVWKVQNLAPEPVRCCLLNEKEFAAVSEIPPSIFTSTLHCDEVTITPRTFTLGKKQEIDLNVTFRSAQAGAVQHPVYITSDIGSIRKASISATAIKPSLEFEATTLPNTRIQMPGEFIDQSVEFRMDFVKTNPAKEEKCLVYLHNPSDVDLKIDLRFVEANFRKMAKNLPEKGELKMFHPMLWKAARKRVFQVRRKEKLWNLIEARETAEYELTFRSAKEGEFLQVLHVLAEDYALGYDTWDGKKRVILFGIQLRGSCEKFRVEASPDTIDVDEELAVEGFYKFPIDLCNKSASVCYVNWQQPEEVKDVSVEMEASQRVEIKGSSSERFCLKISAGKPMVYENTLIAKVDGGDDVRVLVRLQFVGPRVAFPKRAVGLGILQYGKELCFSFPIVNNFGGQCRYSLKEIEQHGDEHRLEIVENEGVMQAFERKTINARLWSKGDGFYESTIVATANGGNESELKLKWAVEKCRVLLEPRAWVLNEMYIGLERIIKLGVTNQGKIAVKIDQFWLNGKGAKAFDFECMHSAFRPIPPATKESYRFTMVAKAKGTFDKLELVIKLESVEQLMVVPITAKVEGIKIAIGTDDNYTDERKPDKCHDYKHGDIRVNFPETKICHLVHKELKITSLGGVKATYSAYIEKFPATKINETDSTVDEYSNELLPASRMACLSRKARLGVFFSVSPASGTLDPLWTLNLKVSAISNIWGEYHDTLVLKFDSIGEFRFPISYTSIGIPVLFRLNNFVPLKTPIYRFGQHVVTGPESTRNITIRNPTSAPMYIEWEAEVGQASDEPPSVGMIWAPRGKGSVAVNGKRKNKCLSFDWTAMNSKRDKQNGAELFTLRPLVMHLPAHSDGAITIRFNPRNFRSSSSVAQEINATAKGWCFLPSEFKPSTPDEKRDDFKNAQPVELKMHAMIKNLRFQVQFLDGNNYVSFYSKQCDLYAEEEGKGGVWQWSKTKRIVSRSRVRLLNLENVTCYFSLLSESPFEVVRVVCLSLRSGSDSSDRELTADSDGRYCVLGRQNVDVTIEFRFDLDQLKNWIMTKPTNKQRLIVEKNLQVVFNEKNSQEIPLRAVLSTPDVSCSHEQLDFGTILVRTERETTIALRNRGQARTVWLASVKYESDESPQPFTISPTTGPLPAATAHSVVTKSMITVKMSAKVPFENLNATIEITDDLGRLIQNVGLRAASTIDQSKIIDPFSAKNKLAPTTITYVGNRHD